MKVYDRSGRGWRVRRRWLTAAALGVHRRWWRAWSRVLRALSGGQQAAGRFAEPTPPAAFAGTRSDNGMGMVALAFLPALVLAAVVGVVVDLVLRAVLGAWSLLAHAQGAPWVMQARSEDGDVVHAEGRDVAAFAATIGS